MICAMKNKVAIVTGGARGIGFAISSNMVRDGFVTCIMGTRDRGECARELDALAACGEVYYHRGSIACAADREAFADSVMERYGSIDVLVNNAGVAPKTRRDILEVTEDSFDHVMGINLKGTMFFTQTIVNRMLSKGPRTLQNRGVIVNISSFSATVSSPNRAEYCVSKAGISMLTKLFADRLARENIFVYEVQPGVIRTDMTAGVADKYNRLIYDAQGNFPIHRWGEPEDVANVVSMFVRTDLSYTTGQVVHCDGGYMNVRSI